MISSIKIVIELFAYLFCLAGLFGKKFKFSIHAMILIVLDLFVLTGINEYGFSAYFRLLVYLGMFTYGLLYYKENIKTTLINCFLAAAIMCIMQIIFWLPVYYIFFKQYGYNEVNELLVNSCCLCGMVLWSRTKQLNKVSEFFLKKNKIITGISLFVIVGLMLDFYEIKRSGILLGKQFIQIIYFFLLFLFIINEWQKSRIEAEKRKTQLEMNKIYYEAYDQLIMLVRERQHDMKNHINAILSMIHTTENYEELVEKQQEYCSFVLKQNEKTKLLLSSENPLITGFLYSKIQEAESKGILVDYCLHIRKNIMFPEYELIEILGILLDNAIEALEKSEIEKKQISLSVKESDDEIHCIIGNTKTEAVHRIDKFFERGYSTKGENRGIGLAKLKNMVLRRNGNLIVSEEPYQDIDFFWFEIQLPKEHSVIKG